MGTPYATTFRRTYLLTSCEGKQIITLVLGPGTSISEVLRLTGILGPVQRDSGIDQVMDPIGKATVRLFAYAAKSADRPRLQLGTRMRRQLLHLAMGYHTGPSRFEFRGSEEPSMLLLRMWKTSTLSLTI